jgi:hypothetical protein
MATSRATCTQREFIIRGRAACIQSKGLFHPNHQCAFGLSVSCLGCLSGDTGYPVMRWGNNQRDIILGIMVVNLLPQGIFQSLWFKIYTGRGKDLHCPHFSVLIFRKKGAGFLSFYYFSWPMSPNS